MAMARATGTGRTVLALTDSPLTPSKPERLVKPVKPHSLATHIRMYLLMHHRAPKERTEDKLVAAMRRHGSPEQIHTVLHQLMLDDKVIYAAGAYFLTQSEYERIRTILKRNLGK